MYTTPTRVSMLNFFLSKNRLFKIQNVTSYTEVCEWAVRENRPTGSLCGRNDFEKYQMKTIIHQSTRRSRLVWMFLVLTFYAKRSCTAKGRRWLFSAVDKTRSRERQTFVVSVGQRGNTHNFSLRVVTVNKCKIPRATGSVCPDRCKCKRVLNVRSSTKQSDRTSR